MHTKIYKSLCTRLIDLDEQLFFIINQFHHPYWDTVVYWITHEAFWIPLYCFLLYLIIKKLKKKSWIALLAIAFLITICDQFSSSLIKPWVQRLRPCFRPDIQSIVHVVGNHKGLYGFISSHAANTFGLATFLYFLFKPIYKYISLLFIWSIGISYARIYGGVHYPADILLGALCGCSWGWMIYKLYKFVLTKVEKSRQPSIMAKESK